MRQHIYAMDPPNISDVKPTIIGAVITLNIIMNSLVIAVIASYPDLRDERTTLFMLSLSVSDLASGCTAMPISAAVCSPSTPSAREAVVFLPKIHMFCVWWFGFNSLHSLCWVTVCKMVALLKPLRHEIILTRRIVIGIIVFNWVLGAAVAASRLSSGTLTFSTTTCTHYFVPTTRRSVQTISAYAFTMVLPGAVLVYATVRIFIVVVRTHISLTAQVHPIGGGAGSAGLVTLQAIRSGRNVLVICAVSVVLTLPLVAFALLRNTIGNHKINTVFSFSAMWLFSCNSFMNSFLYLTLYRSLRQKTRRMFINVYETFRYG